MERQTATALIEANLKAVYAFALKRCRTPEDAEDLSQEIALRAFKGLLAREDIRDPVSFLWTIAHNTLCNYYRKGTHSTVGIPLDEVAEWIPDPDSIEDPNHPDNEVLQKLRREVAYLSDTRRKIVIAYYFENRKQADIAAWLGVPLGTVKWHLFEAKRDLRKGMEQSHMRTNTHLTFHPIRFGAVGINGSNGTDSTAHIFRSTLTQNIAYCVRRDPMTIREIADVLGVSPVYIEGEVQFLENYGLLRRDSVTPRGEASYMADFLMTDPSAELLTMQDNMYKRAADLVAVDLCDRLLASGLLEHPALTGGGNDRNFLLWSLIPFILAQSGEALMDHSISFEEVATRRPGGGHNIFHATVENEHLKLPDDLISMNGWCGPMWNSTAPNALIHWQIDHEWSDRDSGEDRLMTASRDASRALSLYGRVSEHAPEETDPLSREEYAWLSEHGYLAPGAVALHERPLPWQVVILADRDIKHRLLALGDAVKEAHAAELNALKAPYAEASLAAVPPHMRRTQAFELQFVFHSDGWFLLHAIHALLRAGRLTPPQDDQRKSVSIMIFPEG